MLNTLMTWLNARVDVAAEEGQTLVEYALIISLVSIVLVVALTALSGGISGTFNDIITSL
ncbi:Flp family type IVb pilin [Paraconexibacter sp.]|uniref:Flp family type IVb pilin n=1 Tax=Paraconexibacter sp. TaxID=2949640 RepID=UPI0035688025